MSPKLNSGGVGQGSPNSDIAPNDLNHKIFYNHTLTNHLPIVPILIDGISFNALIDSGASINVASGEILQKIRSFNEEDTHSNITIMTGISVNISRSINCKIKLGGQDFETNFYMVDQPLSPNFQIILGLQFLCAFGFEINFRDKTVFNRNIRVSWEKPYIHNNQNHVNTNRAPEGENINQTNNVNFGILTVKTKIPPRSQKMVQLRISKRESVNVNDVMLVEPNNALRETTYLVANAISSVTDTHSCHAQILNPTDQTLTLNKNTKLVSLSPLDIENLDSMQQVNSLEIQEDTDFNNKFNLEHLQKEDKEKVTQLLNEFKHIFANNISQLGNCDIVQHQIHLTDDIPTRQKPYKVPYHLKGEMNKQINELLDAGIIEPSTSAYAAPVLLVKKSDGSFRLCADLRKINLKTLPDNFPIPNMSEMIDLLSGAKYFSSLDLTSGFHQMSMHPSHAHLTAIATEAGHFQFKRMPFGLKNASASFQRLMSIVLSGLSHMQIAVYIDDVIIASNTIEEHIEKLKIVFQRLNEANLKLKPKKCSLLKTEVTYLGHRVKEGQVEPDPRNIESITKSLPPKTKKQVRAFLGLTGFYRKFIPNYSKVALPLTNLTKETCNFKWTTLEQEAFNKLKDSLTSQPCLKLPDFSRPFALCTDASKYALGAVLIQEDEDGFPHPISFASRKLNSPEINYSVFEKEALGVVFGINHFKQYLYGKEFIVYCDQQSLSHIFKLKDPTSRIARWILTLQEYTHKIVHKPGRLNQMADYLSRAKFSVNTDLSDETIPKQVNNVSIESYNLNSLNTDEIIQGQLNDATCKKIIQKLNNNIPFPPSSPKFFLNNGILMCGPKTNQSRDQNRLVVPQNLIHLILTTCHDCNAVAHPGLSRTLHRVTSNFFWYGLYKRVKNYVASCPSCIERRGFAKPTKAPIQKIPTPSRPFEKVSIDAVGPLVTSKHGNKYILVLTDYFTRYPEAYAVPDIQSCTVARVLIDFISRHGLMQVLYSDRGSNFLSVAMSEVYKVLGITKLHTVSYNPAGNGLVERVNKTLIDSLSHLVSQTQEDWCEHVPLALLAFRTAFHRTIQETPAFLAHGRDLMMPYDLIFSEKFKTYNDTPTYAQNLASRLQSTFEIVKINLEKAADNQVSNSEDRKYKNIIVGDTVYLHTPKIKVHTSKKLAKQNKGPYRVIKQCSPVLFEIALVTDPKKIEKVHINRLIKAVIRSPYPVTQIGTHEEIPNKTQENTSNDYVSHTEEELKILYPALLQIDNESLYFGKYQAPRFTKINWNLGEPNINNDLNNSLNVSRVSNPSSVPLLANPPQHSHNLRPRDNFGFVRSSK